MIFTVRFYFFAVEFYSFTDAACQQLCYFYLLFLGISSHNTLFFLISQSSEDSSCFQLSKTPSITINFRRFEEGHHDELPKQHDVGRLIGTRNQSLNICLTSARFCFHCCYGWLVHCWFCCCFHYTAVSLSWSLSSSLRAGVLFSKFVARYSMLIAGMSNFHCLIIFPILIQNNAPQFALTLSRLKDLVFI